MLKRLQLKLIFTFFNSCKTVKRVYHLQVANLRWSFISDKIIIVFVSTQENGRQRTMRQTLKQKGLCENKGICLAPE